MEPKTVETDTTTLPTPAGELPRDIGHDNRVFADETGLPHLANGKRHQPEALRNFENSKLWFYAYIYVMLRQMSVLL